MNHDEEHFFQNEDLNVLLLIGVLEGSFNEKYILQGSVSKHDSIEGQGSGDRVLLNKLYKGETCRLSLVSSHPHKLYISHLLEELQQLLCSGGLWKER